MKFDQLNNIIPEVTGGKPKIPRMNPYNAITLRMPGRHGSGDFVVCIDDETMDWTEHQFTHTDIFNDVSYRIFSSSISAHDFMRDYLKVITGADPAKLGYDDRHSGIGTVMHPQTFLYAVQCLAVAEHRRYSQHEAKGGGRFLPFRFASGIVEGLWTATDAADRQRRGRLGVEWLEKDYGVPALTKELLDDCTTSV